MATRLASSVASRRISDALDLASSTKWVALKLALLIKLADSSAAEALTFSAVSWAKITDWLNDSFISSK